MKTVMMALALSASGMAAAQTLTPDQVIELSAAGVGDEAIIAKLKRDGAAFDLSADQMLELRRRGVSGTVIATMLSLGPAAGTPNKSISYTSPDPMVQHPPGIYILQEIDHRPEMKRIDPIMSSQAKTGGIIGYAFSAGIASMSVKVAIAGETANVRTRLSSPVFYFFFDESNPDPAPHSVFETGDGPAVVSPREFTLARLMRKDGRREARVGSMNIAGAKTGVMDKDRAIFIYDRVRPGVFKIYPQTPLEPGEYGFVMPITGGTQGAGSSMARIFDFSVI